MRDLYKTVLAKRLPLFLLLLLVIVVVHLKSAIVSHHTVQTPAHAPHGRLLAANALRAGAFALIPSHLCPELQPFHLDIHAHTLKLSEHCTIHHGPLPPAVCLLMNLTSLSITLQKIDSFPPCFRNFRSQLSILLLFGARFTHVPNDLAKFSSLRVLSFKSNALKEISPYALPRSLEWLILTGNR